MISLLVAIAALYALAFLVAALSIFCAAVMTILLASGVYFLLTSKHYEWRPWVAAVYCIVFAALIFNPMVHVSIHVIVFLMAPPPWFHTLMSPLNGVFDIVLWITNTCHTILVEILREVHDLMRLFGRVLQ
jgi:hypothetical protein